MNDIDKEIQEFKIPLFTRVFFLLFYGVLTPVFIIGVTYAMIMLSISPGEANAILLQMPFELFIAVVVIGLGGLYITKKFIFMLIKSCVTGRIDPRFLKMYGEKAVRNWFGIPLK